MSSGLQRLLTAAVLVPAMLASFWVLPATAFLVLCLLAVGLAVVEYVAIVRAIAPRAPFWLLHVLVPALAIGLWLVLGGARPASAEVLVAAFGVGMLLIAAAVLLGRTPIGQVAPALGGLAFGLPYFAVPIACLAAIQAQDPWLIFLLAAVVFLGDTGAYYAGSAFGRHKLAPVVSPKKSWEGAIAGLITSLVATAIWCWWRQGEISGPILAVAAATALAAQIGDLVESALKREANIKDSGGLLPGHGGMLDRLDAMLFAAPVFYGGLHLLAPTLFLP